MEFKHKSVLLEETIENLNIKPDGIYVDGTLGGGGHSYEIAKRLTAGGRLIGIDQDADAIKAATDRLKEFADRVTIVRNNYCNIADVLDELGIVKVDGIILDLGVSSYQLDTAERGFTYNVDAPLDMRMDQRQQITAKDIVNTYSEFDLYRIIRDYGEDKFAKNIAKHIVARRTEKPIETTFELNDVIKAAIPMKCRINGGHPAKRTFQATSPVISYSFLSRVTLSPTFKSALSANFLSIAISPSFSGILPLCTLTPSISSRFL